MGFKHIATLSAKMKSVQVQDKSVWEKGFSLLNLVIMFLELLKILSGVIGCLLSLPLQSDLIIHLTLQIQYRKQALHHRARLYCLQRIFL